MKTLFSISFACIALGSVKAAVTFVDPVPDISIPITFGGIYLDLVTEGESSSSQGGVADPGGDSYTVSFSEPAAGSWDLNLFFGGAGIAHVSPGS
ncbi:hypothetical protein N9A86_04975 [Akkermansiaceae bacterium]|nr:hypothetical protein [Akkermansiaceae bacterium]